jgi:hypothetical protein
MPHLHGVHTEVIALLTHSTATQARCDRDDWWRLMKVKAAVTYMFSAGTSGNWS